jgi:hypothetical protein
VPGEKKVCFITDSRACHTDSDCLPDWPARTIP